MKDRFTRVFAAVPVKGLLADGAAGDAIAGVAGRIRLLIVWLVMDDERGAIEMAVLVCERKHFLNPGGMVLCHGRGLRQKKRDYCA